MKGSAQGFELSPVAGHPGAQPGAEARAGAVVVHGFSGSPFEVRPLGRALASQGLHVLGPALAGHAHGDPRELAVTRWQDWYGTMMDAFAAERRRFERVVVVGFSMGGLLALHLAATQPAGLVAIAALSTPIALPDWTRRGLIGIGKLVQPLRAMAFGPRLLARLPMLHKKDGQSDLRDDEMRAVNPTMPAMPFPALAELAALQTLVRDELPLVRVPTFIAHGAQDHTAPPLGADEIERRLGARRVVRLRLPESYHLIPLDVERDLLATALARFVNETLGG